MSAKRRQTNRDLWSDDSWGTYAWNHFSSEMAKVLPSEYSFIDVPANHSMFRTLYDVPKVPQIPGISFWWGTRGGTSEQGADSAEVHVRAIVDRDGHILVLSTHNTDIAMDGSAKGSTRDTSISSRKIPTPLASTFCCMR